MRALLCMALSTTLSPCAGQYWRAIGRGPNTPFTIQTLYGDSALDRLLGAGPWRYIYNTTDTVEAMGIAAWNGSRWDSLGHRMESGAMQTHQFFRYQGTLYASGNWGLLCTSGEWNTGFARYNEATRRWGDLGCVNPTTSHLDVLSQRSGGLGFYTTGYAGDPCGLPTSCAFTYDGETYAEWPPFQQIPYHQGNYAGYVFEFRGKTYMTGSFQNPLAPGTATFLRHNGTAWEYVPGWGNLLSPIKDYNIRNDTLYVSGVFRSAEGGPGNMIARFDGTTWDDMGGGMLYAPVLASGIVRCMHWFHDELWVGGIFTSAGDIAAESIAKWNGRQWCSLNADFQGHLPDFTEPGVSSITSWRDSLYIGGGFSFINGLPARQVAQWLGGTETVACSTPVNVAVRERSSTTDLVLLPNPVDEELVLQGLPDGLLHLELFDPLGRSVWRAQTAARTVPVAELSAGSYILRVVDARGVRLGQAKFLKR